MNIDDIKTKLKTHVPDSMLDELHIVINKFNINTEIRLAHFLAQCSHESIGFTKTIENMNYSAQGLANTWPYRYAIDPKAKVKVPNAFAKTLHRKPIEIANHTYSNRNGNGDYLSGDGWKFKGHGYLQLTGKFQFKELSKFVGEDLILHPELVRTKYALSSAGFYFHNNNLNSISDKGIDLKTIKVLSKKINGGYIGLKHRISETDKFYKLLTN